MTTATKRRPHPFTAGPYRIRRGAEGVDDYFYLQSATTDDYVCRILFWSDSEEWADRAWANAQLLAQAPELFWLLRDLVGALASEYGRNTPPAIDRLCEKALVTLEAAEGR